MRTTYELDQKTKTKDNGVIVIYHRPNSPKWQTRIRINGDPHQEVKSTRTSDEVAAWRFAEDLYDQLLDKFKATGTTTIKSFKKVAEEWLNNLEDYNEPATKIADYRQSLERYAVPHFGNKSIDTIKNPQLLAFVNWRKKNGKNKVPADTTIKRNFVPIKLVFKFALGAGYIAEMPIFPKISAKSKRRAAFTEDEWQEITKLCFEWVRHAKRNCKQQVRDRIYLCYFIRIMGNTGIRPVNESQHLTWECFQKSVSLEGEKRIRIIVPKGKTGNREVVPNSPVNANYLRLLKYRQAELRKIGREFDPTEPIFCHKNGKPIKSFKKGFRAFLHHYGLLKAKGTGEARVQYSLRHTYATMMIRRGINQTELAFNMGTSPKMLYEHYVHNNPDKFEADFLKAKVPLAR